MKLNERSSRHLRGLRRSWLTSQMKGGGRMSEDGHRKLSSTEKTLSKSKLMGNQKQVEVFLLQMKKHSVSQCEENPCDWNQEA
jgi:hypothetical protein